MLFMKRLFLFCILAIGIMSAGSCQKTQEMESQRLYGRGGIHQSGVTTIRSVENIPAWVKSVSLRETGYNGDPVVLGKKGCSHKAHKQRQGNKKNCLRGSRL